MSQEAKDVIQEETVVEEKTEVIDEDTAAMPPPAEKAIEIEKMEEQKLKSKFPGEEDILHCLVSQLKDLETDFKTHLILPFIKSAECYNPIITFLRHLIF